MTDSNPPRFSPNGLLDKVTEAIEKLGVQTYVLVLLDPDSDSDGMARKGSTLWAMGACRDAEDHIRKNRRLTTEGN